MSGYKHCSDEISIFAQNSMDIARLASSRSICNEEGEWGEVKKQSMGLETSEHKASSPLPHPASILPFVPKLSNCLQI